MQLIRILEEQDLIVDYDPENGKYRVSVFENNHFQEEYWFEAHDDKEIPKNIKEEFDKPIRDLFGVAVMFCLAMNLNNNGCKNCPVILCDYEKRTEHEKTCFHEPCQVNLYKWLLAKAKEENSLN